MLEKKKNFLMLTLTLGKFCSTLKRLDSPKDWYDFPKILMQLIQFQDGEKSSLQSSNPNQNNFECVYVENKEILDNTVVQCSS